MQYLHVLFRATVAIALTATIAATPSPHSRATSRPPMAPRPPSRIPYLHLPRVPLHTEFVVEVNHRGQVVRVKSAKGCNNPTFNAQTYGNVLQMWIRHPNGRADVGLFRVTYDYNPHTQRVLRRVALVRLGGNWGNAEGAANQMIDMAKREAEEASGRTLPSLRDIIGPTPTPRPR